jgi:hypothetical protein
MLQDNSRKGVMQKVVFRTAKHGLSGCKRAPFRD